MKKLLTVLFFFFIASTAWAGTQVKTGTAVAQSLGSGWVNAVVDTLNADDSRYCYIYGYDDSNASVLALYDFNFSISADSAFDSLILIVNGKMQNADECGSSCITYDVTSDAEGFSDNDPQAIPGSSTDGDTTYRFNISGYSSESINDSAFGVLFKFPAGADYTRYLDSVSFAAYFHDTMTAACTLAIDSVTVTQLSHAKAKFQVDGHCGWDTVIIEVDTSATAYAHDSTTVTADTTFTDTIGGLFVGGWHYRVIVADGAVRDTVTGTFSQDWLVSQIDTAYFTETHLNYSSNKDSFYIQIYTDCSVQGDTIVHKLSLSGYPDSSTGNYLKRVKDSTCVVSVSYDTISAIQPETVYVSAWNTKYAGGERNWSNRWQGYFVTAIVPLAVSALSIDTTFRSTSISDTVTTSVTGTGNLLGSFTVDSIVRVYTYGANTSPDSLATNHRWACRAATAESEYVFLDTMRVLQPDTVRVYVWQVNYARAEGVWSTRTMAKKYWPAPAADTSKIQDVRIITFYDKRAKTLGYIDDEDSLGHNNPDTTNPVDWHPYFNFVNNRGVATESVKVSVIKPTGDILCQWAESLVCANTARSRNIVYPSDTTYDGHSIVIQSGLRYSYRVQTKATDSTWTSPTAPQYFWGVIPDSIDTKYPGYRNYVPVWMGSSNSGFSANTYTATVEYPTGWGYIIDSMGVPNGATPELANYGGFSYVVYQRVPDSTQGYTAVIRRNDSTNVWSAPNDITQSTGDYAHDYSKIAISSDSVLWFVIGGHNTRSHIYRTKTSHVTGSGIDICDTCWVEIDSLSLNSVRKSTYPYFVNAGGYLFLFFRDKCSSAADTYTVDGCSRPGSYWSTFSYIRYNPADSTWCDRKGVIKYPTPWAYTANQDSNTSVYHSVFNQPGTNRVWAHITYWNAYGSPSANGNRGRATAILYSDLDDTGYFSTWYQVESATPLSDSDDYSITYKEFENFHPNSDTMKAPFVLGNNQESGIVGNQYNSSAFTTSHPIYVWQNEEVATVWSFYNSAWSEWVKINLGGHTLFRAKEKGNHNAYTVNIDTGTYEGTIKIIIKNKASTPDTTETFDSLTSYGAVYTAINHGLAGVNSGNASNLVRIEWIGCTLTPYTAESTLANGDTATYSWLGIRDTTQNYCWTHHRGGHQIYEADNNRLYVYQIVKPRGKTWFGGELERTNMWGVGEGFPTITKTMMTNSSGEGIPTIGALPRVGYSYETTRNKYTPNFKELVMSAARNVLWIPDKYVVNSYNDIRVYSATIDSFNAGTVTYLERNRLIENRMGLLKTRIMFRASPGIYANSNAPLHGTYIIASGNPSAGTPPDTITKVLPALATGNSYEGFEGYADSSDLDDASAWVVSGTGTATVYSGQNIYPENAWQGDKYVDFADSVDAKMACGTQSSARVKAFFAMEKSTTNNGNVWMYISSASTGGRDSCIKYLGFSQNGKPISKNVYSKDTTRSTSGSATSDSLWSGGGNLVASDNRYATIKKSGSIYIYLTKNGTAGYGDSSTTITLSTVADSVSTAGSNAALWGTEMNKDSVCQSNFGVILRVGGAHIRAVGFGFSLPTASKVIGVTAYVEGRTSGSWKYIDQVRLGVRYTVNEDTAWTVHSAASIQLGLSNYYPVYHKFEFTCVGGLAKLYVNGTLFRTLPMSSFNTVGFGAGADCRSFIDNITIRSYLANEPEPRTCFTAEQILGAEESNVGYARRINLLKEMGR